ncbi:MAG: hypothetical protein U0232_13205 [Thermomicrobiales bacterium]
MIVAGGGAVISQAWEELSERVLLKIGRHQHQRQGRDRRGPPWSIGVIGGNGNGPRPTPSSPRPTPSSTSARASTR